MYYEKKLILNHSVHSGVKNECRKPICVHRGRESSDKKHRVKRTLTISAYTVTPFVQFRVVIRHVDLVLLHFAWLSKIFLAFILFLCFYFTLRYFLMYSLTLSFHFLGYSFTNSTTRALIDFSLSISLLLCAIFPLIWDGESLAYFFFFVPLGRS